VVSDIDNAGLAEVVIVGHSMAGLTVPAAVTKLGPSRVREMVLAASFVPPEGSAFVDTFPGLLGVYGRRNSRRALKRGIPGSLPKAWAAYTFCNGMTRERRNFNLERLYAESPSVVLEKVDRTGMPDDVPRTWLLTLRDRTISLKSQRRSIEALGGVQTLIEMNTCHNLMISEPERLAEILVERCRLYAS
jgi:pimeloyl-ACP methyl ester carboxylesterase